MPTSSTVLIDDRLLVEHLLGAPIRVPRRATISTTMCWHYRAGRAAIGGGQGKLSGPFAALTADERAAAVEALLRLPDAIGLPDPRTLVQEMVHVYWRHQKLNLINVEAAAAALLLRARVLLSPPAADGVLPAVLDAEGVPWDVVGVA